MIEVLQEQKLQSPIASLHLVCSGRNITLELWISKHGRKNAVTRCVVADIKPGDDGLVLRNTVNGIAMSFYDEVKAALPAFDPMAIACLTMIE